MATAPQTTKDCSSNSSLAIAQGTISFVFGLPHSCPVTYAAYSCGHPLDPLGTHLMRCTCGASTLHHMILCAIWFTTSFVSRASTRIGSAMASFLHRLLGGACRVQLTKDYLLKTLDLNAMPIHCSFALDSDRYAINYIV